MIRIDRDGKIATVTLDRPERMNALSPDMFRDLGAFWREFQQDDVLHVAIVTGEGRAFCSGRDLVRPTAMEDEKARSRSLADRAKADDWPLGPDGVWKPVIAAINGWCLAGGFALALSCDLRIMSESARIGSMAPKRGLVPGGGQVARLARYVPFAKALELLLRGNHVDANEAAAMGLVNAVTAPEELLPTARAWAEEIAGNAPLAVRAVKRAVYEGALLPSGFREGLALEAELYASVATSDDAAEGTIAFREKRPAVYQGR
ncbi:MAG TPA: enoyl-CoA hydratase-related protein [Dehalococcoidia bacterium]|nr:enoyl-CoA hydratase-related protein [Dehalococcoidia bacterium]